LVQWIFVGVQIDKVVEIADFDDGPDYRLAVDDEPS
jgi:hypothetical protein